MLRPLQYTAIPGQILQQIRDEGFDALIALVICPIIEDMLAEGDTLLYALRQSKG